MKENEELELYKCFAGCLSSQVLTLWNWIPDFAKESTTNELQKLMQPYEDMREKLKIGRG